MILPDDFPNWREPAMRERLKRAVEADPSLSVRTARRKVEIACVLEATDKADTLSDLRRCVKALAKLAL